MDSRKTPRTEVFISDSTEMNLVCVPNEVRQKLAMGWSKPAVRIPDGVTNYRFVNYLSQTGLLDDRREVSGKGWRKFSYVECIYLNLVVSLRKFGVKAEFIKPIYALFFEQYNEQKQAIYMGLDWLDVLIAVHCGTEFELIVKQDGTTLLADPPMMKLFGVSPTEGSLRISMSAIVNKLRAANNMSLVKITNNFGTLGLSEAEISTVLSMRNLREGQERISIKRTKGGKLHVGQEKIVDADDSNFAEKITELMKDDFADVQLVKRNGKVVNVKQTKSELFKN